MAALEEKLKGTALLRVHRSAFVRPDKVVEVKRANRSLTLLLADGAHVQVGPSYIAAVKEALGPDCIGLQLRLRGRSSWSRSFDLLSSGRRRADGKSVV